MNLSNLLKLGSSHFITPACQKCFCDKENRFNPQKCYTNSFTILFMQQPRCGRKFKDGRLCKIFILERLPTRDDVYYLFLTKLINRRRIFYKCFQGWANGSYMFSVYLKSTCICSVFYSEGTISQNIYQPLPQQN